MSVETLLTRYSLDARAKGLSPKTISHTKRCVGFFTQFLGGISDVRKVTADDLRRFLVACQSQTKWSGQPQSKGQLLTTTSINTYCRAIKAFWSWMKDEAIIKDDTLANVKAPKLPKRLPKTLTEEEITKVLKAVKGDRDDALIKVFLDSGMRLAELCNLNKDDLNQVDGSAKVFGKGEKERIVYLSHETNLAVQMYLVDTRPEPKGDNKLFLTQDGYPLSPHRVQKILSDIGKKAGIAKRLSPHKLRHTYATMVLRAGGNLEFLRMTLGHSEVSTSQIYVSLANADVAMAHRKFSPVTKLAKKR